MQIRTIALRGLNQTEKQFGDMLSQLNTWGMPNGMTLAQLNITDFDCYDAAGFSAAANATPLNMFLFLWGISFGGSSAIQATGGAPLGTNHPFPLINRPADAVLLIDPVDKDHSGAAWAPGVFKSGPLARQTLTVWRNPPPTESDWSSPCNQWAAPAANIIQRGPHVAGQWDEVNSWPAILRVTQGKGLIATPPPGDLWTLYQTRAATVRGIDTTTYAVVGIALVETTWYQINSAGEVWTLPGSSARRITDPALIAQVRANANPPI